MKLTKHLLLIALTFVSLSAAYAQNSGTIRGTVKDAQGEVLPGASVYVNGTTNGTATDLNGNYTLQGVKTGEVQIKCSYLGYKEVSYDLEVSSKTVNVLDIVMTELDNALAGVTVTAAIDGQQRALNQQKLADNQMQVISADQIGLFPDLNVTDALKRVGGITTDGSTVSMRGTPSNFTNININGEQLVGTGEGGTRAPNLEVIPSDVLSSMEVQKTLLPSNDGDAIAGVINLRTGEARSLKPKFKIEVGPGYNFLRDKLAGNVKLGYEQRYHPTDANPYGTFGLVTRLSYYNSYSGYDRLDANNWVLSSVNGQDEQMYMPMDFRYRYVTNHTQRFGATVVFDWAPSLNTKFVLVGTYNRQNTDTDRERMRYRFRGNYYTNLSDYDFSSDEYDSSVSDIEFGENAYAADRVQQMRQYTDIEEDMYNYSINLSGETTKGNWKVDGSVVYTAAETAYTSLAYGFETPDYRANGKVINGSGESAMTFQKNTPVAYIPDITSRYLTFDYLKSANGSMEGRAMDQVDNYTLYNVESWCHTTESSTTTAKVNASYNHNVGEGSAVLSFGGKYKHITTNGYVPEGGSDVYSYSLPKNSYGNSELNMSNFVNSDYVTDNFLNKGIALNYGLDKGKLRDFANANFNGLLEYDESASGSAADAYYFDAKENIFAGYVMEKIQFEKLMVLAGVRVEANTVKYAANTIFQYDSSVDLETNPTGQNPENLLEDGDGAVYDAYTSTPNNDSQNYVIVLPNIQFKYDINRQTLLRLAYTTGYSRPDANDLVPKTSINTDAGVVTMGNPNLKPAYSHNIDLIAEHYFGSVGLISAGLFYKHINKFVYLSQTSITSDSPYGYDNSPFSFIRQKQNGKAANVYGLEVTLNSALTFLPGFLRNLVFTSNFTLIHSNATLERLTSDDASSSEEAVTDDVRLPGQADYTANFALAYSAKKFTIQGSVNYIGDFIQSLGANEDMDVWVKGRWTLDANASYNITKNITFYVEANNILNSKKFLYMGNTDRVYELRMTGAAARCGFKFNF